MHAIIDIDVLVFLSIINKALLSVSEIVVKDGQQEVSYF